MGKTIFSSKVRIAKLKPKTIFKTKPTIHKAISNISIESKIIRYLYSNFAFYSIGVNACPY